MARKKARDASMTAAKRANASVPVLPSNELRTLLKMQSRGMGKVSFCRDVEWSGR